MEKTEGSSPVRTNPENLCEKMFREEGLVKYYRRGRVVSQELSLPCTNEK